MPMSYLCNTFFSTSAIPHGAREVIAALPLSQTSAMIRAIATGEPADFRGILILLVYLLVFIVAGLYFVYKKENL